MHRFLTIAAFTLVFCVFSNPVLAQEGLQGPQGVNPSCSDLDMVTLYDGDTESTPGTETEAFDPKGSEFYLDATVRILGEATDNAVGNLVKLFKEKKLEKFCEDLGGALKVWGIYLAPQRPADLPSFYCSGSTNTTITCTAHAAMEWRCCGKPVIEPGDGSLAPEPEGD